MVKKLFIVFAVICTLTACSVGGPICESFRWDNGITNDCLSWR